MSPRMAPSNQVIAAQAGEAQSIYRYHYSTDELLSRQEAFSE